MPITMRNVCLERLETPGRTNTVQETRGFFFLFKATQGFYAEKKNKKQKTKTERNGKNNRIAEGSATFTGLSLRRTAHGRLCNAL